MANDTIITVVGNLTEDPELRFTPSGAAVSNFTIASTPSHFDKASGEFKDEEILFVRCTAWRGMAENVAESLSKGMRVMAHGRLKAQSYEAKDGAKRTAWDLHADDVAPSLKFATASVSRNGKGTQAPQAAAPTAQPAADPWGQQQGGWGGAPGGDAWGAPQQQTEAPF